MNPTPTGMITPITSRRRVAPSEHGAMSPQGATSRGGRAATRPSARITRIRPLAHDGEDGFTLVELLVVVLMLVALVGIAVPTFIGQQERAERAAVQSELRTAAIALESYRARNGGYDVEALESAAFGFVQSLDVVTFIDEDEFRSDRFCVRAWYHAVDPGVVRDESASAADAKAEWAITENGMAYLGAESAPRTCPQRPGSS